MRTGTDRGLSDVIAYSLLVGVVLISTVVILNTGVDAVEQTQSRSGLEKAENALTEFDATMSSVALHGGVEQKAVQLGATSQAGESLQIRQEGQISISVGDTKQLQTDLGALVYESGVSEVGYQSGAVFRHNNPTNSTRMVSNPEIHFSRNTLTMAITAIDEPEQQILHDQFRLRNQGGAPGMQDSVSGQDVTINVTSKYYKGWGQYFESQFEGASEVTYYDDEQKVSVTVGTEEPVKPSFNGSIVSQSNVQIAGCGSSECVANDVSGRVIVSNTMHGYTSDSVEEGASVNIKPETAFVQQQVGDAYSNGNRIGGEDEVVSSGRTLGSGVYYTKGIDYGEGMYSENTTVSERKLTLDASGGDITLVVDGDIRIGSNASINVNEGDNQVRIITTGDVLISGHGDGVTASQPGAVEIYGAEETDAMIDNRFMGGLYVPTSSPTSNGLDQINDSVFCQGGSYDVCLGQTADVRGSIVAGGFRIHHGASVAYSEPAGSNTEIATVRQPHLYLHVSESYITLRD